MTAPTNAETLAETTALRLHPDARAPRIARRVVRSCCAMSELPARVVDDAIFVAGEMVTAAIKHARRPVEFRLELDAAQVLVRVRASPAAFPPTVTEWDTSRWIAVIKRLSSCYGLSWDGRTREMWACLRS